MSSWWQPVDVTEWTEHALEPRGRRAKMWLRAPDGSVWLRKSPPPPDPRHPDARRAEPAIELFALELARRAGLPVATKAMMQAWGVENPDDPFEVLAKSGGIRATDRIELAEYRPVDDELERPLEFRVASRRHLPDAAQLAIGDTVTLRRERDNPADPLAVIVDRDGNRAGYVPRQYGALFTRLLDRSTAMTGEVVRKLIVPDDAGKWVVRMQRIASLAAG